MAHKEINKSAKKQIRSLIFVLSCSVGCAFLVTLFFLYNYGPSGRYAVRNVLLAPELILSLNYNDTNTKTGGDSRFVFDDIEFSYYDNTGKKWNKLHIDHDHYSQFYQLIVSDISLQKVSRHIEAMFQERAPSSLVLKVRTDSSAKWQEETKIFQEIHFVEDGDYYRIELHEENKTQNWAYFYHPNIYQEVLRLFVPSTEIAK